MNSEYNELKEKYIEYSALLQIQQNREPYNVTCRRAFVVACVKSGYTSELIGRVVGLNRSNCSHSLDKHVESINDKLYSKNYLIAMSMVADESDELELINKYSKALDLNSELYNNNSFINSLLN